MIRINRKGLRILSGALIGAAIGAVIVSLTLTLILDTDP